MLYPQQNDIRNLLDLSGFWGFQLDPGQVGEAEGWQHGLSAPRQIAVPGSWNEQFQDTRDYMGLAWYARAFYVPSGWNGQELFVRVGSANYAAKVWINGEIVGSHEGGHLPFDLEITPQVRWGAENLIAIGVENELKPTRVPPGNVARGGFGGFMSGFPSTNFDFFPYGGLHRPVILFAVPPRRIEDVTVNTVLVGEDGIVDVEVIQRGEGGAGRVRVRGQGFEADAPLSFQGSVAEAAIRVPKARLWSPDNPFLYDLEVTLDAGEVIDRYRLPVGIRTISVQGDRLLLNGKPIMLKGFGKHEDFPVHGRGLNMPLIIKDAALFKWIGANSYRTSHYPYSDEAMDIADREGTLVVDEIPAVGLFFEDGEENIQTRLGLCKRQLRELVARDKNHPSVIMWSVANEPMPPNAMRRMMGGDGGRNEPNAADASALAFFRELYSVVRDLDPTRPATSAAVMGCPVEWMALADVVFINRYWGWYVQAGQLDEGAQMLAQELDGLHQQLGKPIVISEFGADSLAGVHADPPEVWSEEYQVEMLRRYLDVAAARPYVAGLHVWNFADFKVGQSPMRAGGMNRKGVFTRDRRPKMAAHFLRERWAQPTGVTAAQQGVAPQRAPEPPAPPQPVVPEAFLALAAKLNGKNPGLNAVLKFDLGEGRLYRFVFESGACRAEAGPGAGEATATVTMQAEDAMKLLRGELNPMVAYMTGKIKIAGDIRALMALQGALG